MPERVQWFQHTWSGTSAPSVEDITYSFTVPGDLWPARAYLDDGELVHVITTLEEDRR